MEVGVGAIEVTRDGATVAAAVASEGGGVGVAVGDNVGTAVGMILSPQEAVTKPAIAISIPT